MANSGCWVASPPCTRLRSSKRTVPPASTSREPNGSSPASNASRASSTQRRRCFRSVSLRVIPPSWTGGAVAAADSPRERDARVHRTSGVEAVVVLGEEVVDGLAQVLALTDAGGAGELLQGVQAVTVEAENDRGEAGLLVHVRCLLQVRTLWHSSRHCQENYPFKVNRPIRPTVAERSPRRPPRKPRRAEPDTYRAKDGQSSRRKPIATRGPRSKRPSVQRMARSRSAQVATLPRPKVFRR